MAGPWARRDVLVFKSLRFIGGAFQHVISALPICCCPTHAHARPRSHVRRPVIAIPCESRAEPVAPAPRRLVDWQRSEQIIGSIFWFSCSPRFLCFLPPPLGLYGHFSNRIMTNTSSFWPKVGSAKGLAFRSPATAPNWYRLLRDAPYPRARCSGHCFRSRL